MTDTDLEIIVFVLLAVAIGVYVCVSSSIKRKKAAENAIKKAWGKRVVYKGTDESFEYISHYAKGNPSESMIDDITWNDLGTVAYTQLHLLPSVINCFIMMIQQLMTDGRRWVCLQLIWSQQRCI